MNPVRPTKSARKRVLFVAMQDSTHAAKWISQLTECEHLEVHLFPISKTPPHERLSGVIFHDPDSTAFLQGRKLVQEQRIRPDLGSGWFSMLRNAVQSSSFYGLLLKFKRSVGARVPRKGGDLNRLFPWIDDPLANDPRDIARLIDRLNPDMIHSLEFQHCGYSVLAAKRYVKREFPKWLATNWGSDVYYFRHQDLHERMIRQLLESIDYYSCECHRDIEIVKEMGYQNAILPVIPNTGGFDINLAHQRRTRLATSKRKSILVKGYQSFAGRALVALDAIELCADDLSGYVVKVYSATSQTRERVRELSARTSIEFKILEHMENSLMHDEFAAARAYIGISVSDGISTSSLESMALGAFPIQTNTSCCSEWFEDGKGGFIVPVDDVQLIADKIKTMLNDDALVDFASKTNWATVCSRLDRNVIKKVAQNYYQTILG